ncbi:MAG: amidohydrolase family protein, partial [Symbiobacteriaceae bacterium]|nr:amidohydrolase family protein [Symbiobacteriaceae bacterium]
MSKGTLLVKNATVYTLEETGTLANADVLIVDGVITQIGHNLSAVDAEVLDASGLHVIPGMIDAHSHAGGFETYSAQSDVNENTNPITPQMNIIHSIDVTDPSFQVAHKVGVTTVCIPPGSANVICGYAITAKTAGSNIYDMVIQNPAAMKCALGGNPKGYGRRNQMPATRMGVAFMLRDALRKASEYSSKQAEAAEDTEKVPAFDAQSEALLPVLRGEIPLKIHCEQFDMLTAIAVAKEFNLSYTIEHGWAGDQYLDELAAGGGAVCFGPVCIVEGVGELTGGDVAVAKAMDERGICVSLITDAPIFSNQALLLSAGEAVRVGVPHLRALGMITLNPAVALRLDHKVGSLAIGKDGDLAIFE